MGLNPGFLDAPLGGQCFTLQTIAGQGWFPATKPPPAKPAPTPSACGDGDRSTDLPSVALAKAKTSAKLEALRGFTTQDKVFSAAQQANNKPVHNPFKNPLRNNY